MKPNNDLRKKIEDFSYALCDVIYKGSLGTVYVGTNDRTKEKVAIKVIETKAIKNLNGKYSLDNETEALRKLSHHNIVRSVDIYMTANNRYILTEFCNQGNLEEFVAKKKGKICEQQCLQIFGQIFEGVRYMVGKGFIHRRLEPSNVLIKDHTFKVGNFSMVRKEPLQLRKDDIPIANHMYCSPEALDSGMYSEKSDVWSMGVILYQLLHNSLPWPVRPVKDHIENILRTSLEFDEAVSEQCRVLIGGCLAVQIDSRLSMSQLQACPLVQKVLDNHMPTEQLPSPRPLARVLSGQNIPLGQQKRSSQERILVQQINLMRFMYRLYNVLPTGSLKFILLKQLLSTLEALKGVTQLKNTFHMEDFDKFILNDKCKSLFNVIQQYSRKYVKLYAQYETMLSKGTGDTAIKHYFNSSLERSQGVAIAAVQCCLRDIKEIRKKLKEHPDLKQIGQESALPEAPQKLAFTLDFVTTYYQLNCLMIDNWKDLEYFARVSKVDVLAEVPQSPMEKRHIKDIENKLKDLQII